MRFTRLRLTGFKSFVEPVELYIEPGLTGIVGPNGCGKSNLVEAISWVMGEASAKNMRGTDMDDVIFNGANGRPSRNMAEVSLVIDNFDHTAPANINANNELEISRRIEREAGSVYRINGREARARDVGLVFADAASGPRSSSIVRQGKIGNLINAKPRERRAILEEAAGIGGLYSRRHEAELRLRAAETNLTRLDDIMAQIETQLIALKRQARQAIRYHNLSRYIRRTEGLVFHLRWQETAQAAARAITLLEAAQVRVNDATLRAAAASSAQLQAAEAIPPLRRAEAEAAAGLHRLTVARDGLQAEGERIGQQISRVGNMLVQAGQDAEREASLLGDSLAALQRLTEERDGLLLALAENEGKGEVLQAGLARAQAALLASEAALDAANHRLADLLARRGSLEREVQQAAQRLDRLGEQLRMVVTEHQQIQQDMPAAPLAESMAISSVAARAALNDSRETVMGAEKAHQQAQQVAAGLLTAFQAVRSEADKLAAEEKALADLLNDHGQDLWPPLVDALIVEPGYEAALGAALGDDLDYPGNEAAPAHWALVGGKEPLPSLPDGVEPLSRFARGAPVLERRLSQIGVVSPGQADQLRTQLACGQRLVTRQGALWRWDGFTAAAGAPAASARRLQMRNRLTEISAQRRQIEGSATAARERYEDAQEQARNAHMHAEEHRRNARLAEEELTQALDRQAEAGREAISRTARLAALTEARARIESEVLETGAQHQAAQSALASLEPEAQPYAVAAELRSEVEINWATLSQARGELDGFAREVRARNERLQSVAQEASAWMARKQDAERQSGILSARAAQLADERDNLKSQPEEIRKRLEALTGSLSGAAAKRDQAADALALAERTLVDCDRNERSAQAALADAREALVRNEEVLNAATARAEDMAAQISGRLNCAPEETLAIAEMNEGEVLPSIDLAESDLGRYKRERENMGAVNLRAAEEAQELRDRLDGMASERADLEGAISRLRQAIGSLNREGRERLLKAFAVVNGHFSRLFTHLFGGGEARLELAESDDPLEAGLEILASPPGKRLQSMTLLSGGEQALTALSLIFAVFLTNPSPLCVLDEVDAPLDDANVERFCGLLEEMCRLTDTRFMVITHNSVTMSRMDRLFGVTMAEKGVSQLVSVDLERAERLRAIA